MIQARRTRVRLDQVLVSRGLAASRERARALILANKVRVAGVAGPLKAGQLVDADSEVELAQPDHPYVSRGGLKLAHALQAFGIDVAGRVALDIGASTGGFTDVLLQQGARHVVALDVGHGQLDWRIRRDERVSVREHVNARYLSDDDLPDEWRQFDLVTVDVSFISLKLILPVIPARLRPEADVVALVKPQFEAGRHDVGKGGIVRDPAVHERVVEEVVAAAADLGLQCIATTPSPIEGMEGNVEWLAHFRRSAQP